MPPNQGDDFIVGLSVDADKIMRGLEDAIKKAAILERQVRQAQESLTAIASIKTTDAGKTTAQFEGTTRKAKRAIKELKGEADAVVAMLDDIPRAAGRAKTSTRAASGGTATVAMGSGRLEIKSAELGKISGHLGGIKGILKSIEMKLGVLAPGKRLAEEKVLAMLGGQGSIFQLVDEINMANRRGKRGGRPAGMIGSDVGVDEQDRNIARRANIIAMQPRAHSQASLRDWNKSYAIDLENELASGDYKSAVVSATGYAKTSKELEQRVAAEKKKNEAIAARSMSGQQQYQSQKRVEYLKAEAQAYAENEKRAGKINEYNERAMRRSKEMQQAEQSRQRSTLYTAEEKAYPEYAEAIRRRREREEKRRATGPSAYMDYEQKQASSRREKIGDLHTRAIIEDNARTRKLGVGEKEGVVEGVFRRALMFGVVSAGIFKAVDAGRVFIQTMITMDKQMADLHKTLGGTKEDFEKLIGSAIQIARTYKGATQDVLDAMEIFSGQFKASSDLEALSKSAILFSNISGQGLKESAETLTATIQQYELAASQALDVTDSWANVAANSAVTIGDLGAAFGSAGNAAKVAGVTIDELNSMIAVVATATGKSGKEIGNAFKRIFERSTSDDNAGDLYEKFGISVKDMAGNFRPFTQILEDVNAKWQTWSDTQKKQIAVMFAGARQYDAFIALMDNYKSSTDLVTISQNSLGAAQRQNERIGDTFTKKLQMMSNEYDNLARVTGERVLPAMGGLVDIMTALMKMFNDSSSGVKTFALSLGSILGANLAGSALFKFISVTKTGDKFGVRKNAGSVANFLGGSVDAATGSVSLLGGIGRKVMGTGAGSAMAGIAGSMGISAGVTAFVTGLATVSAALVVLYGAVKGIIAIYNDLRDTTKELVQQQQDILLKSRQEQQDIVKTVRSIQSLVSDRNEIANDKSLLPEEKTRRIAEVNDTLSGILSDTSLKNPGLLGKEGIVFDNFGRAVNATDVALKRLTDALERTARDIESKGQKDTTQVAGAALKEILQSSGGDYGSMFRIARANSNIPSTMMNSGEQYKTLRRISEGLGKAGIGIQSIGDDPQAIGNLQRRGDIFPQGMGIMTSTGFVEILKDFDHEKQQFLSQYGAKAAAFAEQKVKIFRKENQKAMSKEQLDKGSIEVYEKESENFMRQQITAVAMGQGIFDKNFIELLVSGLPSPLRGGTTRGPAGGGSNKVNVPEHDITRIDFELNKALVTNARNYKAFGGSSVNLAEGALSAYKTAYSDILNEINKAAGPQEQAAMIENMKEIDKLREKRNKAESRGDRGGALKLNQEIAVLQGKQGILEERLNKERAAGKEILDATVERLQHIVDLQNILRDPLKNMLTNALPANEAITLANRKYQQADSVNFENQRMRARELYDREMAQLNASGASDLQKRNAGVRYRNQLMDINEQDKAAKKSLDENAKQNNVFTKMIEGVGSAAIGKISSNIVDNMLSRLVEGEDGIFGMKLFGQDNPQVNALNGNSLSTDANTAALNSLTTTLGGTAASGAVGGGAAAAAGGVGGAEGTPAGGIMGKIGGVAMAGLAGMGVGGAFTKGRGKEGMMGSIFGGIGAAAGSFLGPLGTAAGGLLGGLLGSMLDKDITFDPKPLEELEEVEEQMVLEMQRLEKRLNTVNETMENLINAPANFALPIPRGILENSITAQSAIATPLQAGGLVLRSGPAFLHAGERVMRRNDVATGGGMSVSNSITIQGANKDPQEIANEVMNKLNSAMFTQMQRTGNYRQLG